MNKSQLALSVFRKAPLSLNCAQSVCYSAGREDLLESMATCGGGRVPGGTCGALYAALEIAGDKADWVQKQFLESLGALTCKELKGKAKVPCERCVSIAADLLD